MAPNPMMMSHEKGTGGLKPMAILILGAVLIGALAVRIAGIDWGLPSKTLTLATYHPDEAFLFQSLENIYKTKTLNPKKIALHYGTFHFYIAGLILLLAKILGFISLGSREFLLQNLGLADRMYLLIRGFSVLCALASVWGVFLLARRVFNEKVGLWAAFFMALSPISIAASHVAKLDALLPPLVILLSWWTINLVENPSAKNAWIAGILSGLIASTRYNCGSFILAPLGILLLNRGKIPAVRAVPLLAGAFFAFLLTTPYALLDYQTFFAGLRHMESFVTTPTLPSFRESRMYNLIYIFETMMPFSMGWAATLLFLFGSILCIKRGAAPADGVLLLGFASFVFVLCLSSARYTHYFVPLLPAACVFSASGAVRLLERAPKPAGILLAVVLILAQSGEAWSFNSLFFKPNPREEAGEWILRNAEKKDAVGMIRSYFWTPGIFRQKNPPLTVVKAGEDLSEFIESVANLKRMKPSPRFFILSENERRTVETMALLERKDDSEMLENFLSRYELVQTFELEPRIGPVQLWLREAPWDLRLVAPKIWVYRLKS